MRRTISILTILVLAILQANAGNEMLALSSNKEKRYHKSWSVNEIKTLQITNKYGKVSIAKKGGSEITVDVTISANNRSNKKLEEIFEIIKVQFQKSGSLAIAETIIDGNLHNVKNLKIDYKINIPNSKNLIINNKYGNIVLQDLNANGEFTCKYGNISANKLIAPSNKEIKINLGYGNANISTVNNLKMELKYGNIDIQNVDNFELLSKYSDVNIEKVNKLQLESKYDKFNIDEINLLEVESKYTHFRIDRLNQNLTMTNGYGGIKIKEVNPDFELIKIISKYGNITLGLEQANYEIDASCDYCDIVYPQNDFKGKHKESSNSEVLWGAIGSTNGGKIIVESRYGSILLK